MEVLEHQDGRAPLRERLQEPPPCALHLMHPIVLGTLFGREAEERAEVTLDPGLLVRVSEQGGDRRVQLRGRLVVGVGLEDTGLRLHHLAEGPVAHAVPVGGSDPVAS